MRYELRPHRELFSMIRDAASWSAQPRLLSAPTSNVKEYYPKFDLAVWLNFTDSTICAKARLI
jgi:hypothetical protein